MADPQQIIQSQTSIPDYARAQVERMLGATEGAIYDYQRDAQGNLVKDASGAPIVTGLKPYQQYQGQRIAGPDVLSQQAYNTRGGMGIGAQAGNSLQNMYNLAAQAGQSQYNPTAYGNQYAAPGVYQPGQFSYQGVGPQNAQYFQMQGPQNVRGAMANAAYLGNAPTATSQAMQAAQMGASPTAIAQAMQAAQMGMAPTVSGQTGVASLLNASPEMISLKARIKNTYPK